MKGADFIRSALRQLNYYKALGDRTIGRLNDTQMHFSAAEHSNSIAVIIRHLEGNMRSRWTDFLTTDGEKPWRDRDREFGNERETMAELMAKWNDGWKLTLDAVAALKPADIERTVSVRGEAMMAGEAVHRAIAHYAYHVGQIVYLGKLQLGDQWESLSIPRGAR